MSKRFLALGVCFALLLPVLARAQTRQLQLRYEADLERLPPGAASAELWIPLAHDDPQQRIRSVKVEGADGGEVVHDARYGNAALHLTPKVPARVVVTYVVERREEHHQLTGGMAAAAPADPIITRWLKPDKLGSLTPTVQSFTQKTTAGKTGTLAKVRAIYDFVVATMSYDKSGQGWGRGDIVWACDAKRGNCTDFHTLFVAMARAAGVPARFEIGLPLPDERGQGEIPGYHCWARFYLDGQGWIPVDASEAKKHLDKKEFFFGGHDVNRVQFTTGRDLRFPGMVGELNYFIHPYAEAGGKSIPVAYHYSYRDLSEPSDGQKRSKS